MGGKLSHEFHFPADMGEDILVNCESCGQSTNAELGNPQKPANQPRCPKCSSWKVSCKNGIEVFELKIHTNFVCLILLVVGWTYIPFR